MVTVSVEKTESSDDVLSSASDDTLSTASDDKLNNSSSNMAVVYVCKVSHSIINGLVEIFIMFLFSEKVTIVPQLITSIGMTGDFSLYAGYLVLNAIIFRQATVTLLTSQQVQIILLGNKGIYV